ncbi:MAG: hypothetical protein ACFB5Z_01155 [Elainellaceae cyanobacterium]
MSRVTYPLTFHPLACLLASLGWAAGMLAPPAQAQLSAPLPTLDESSASDEVPDSPLPDALPADALPADALPADILPGDRLDEFPPIRPLNPLPDPITPPTSVTPTAAPLFENVTLAPSAPDVTVRGISGGSQLATAISGRQETDTGACVGYVDGDADHRLVLTDFFEFLSLRVESPEDTTLVVRGPGGSWCSDDLNGRNPGILGAWSPGAYEIWVGSYQPGDYYPYVIRITAQPEANSPL